MASVEKKAMPIDTQIDALAVKIYGYEFGYVQTKKALEGFNLALW